ncbi:arylalkylamine N-acetyltransferase 1-like [Lutzomyia longipalpis]|uniref:arylalkylamine N-acetyltransferase 1-like n=1 Tax=Lutzomyia longipalpis TaxID=7200 RepID=UPI0024836C1D|nr:arylalkylamine N-acetyltransferase 1-like [Lutzomyia longipalpis]
MSQKRFLYTFDNDNFAIQLYNPETDQEGSLKVLKEGFLQHENICIAVGLNASEETQGQRDVAKLFEANLSDGISLVARYLPTNEIVGFSINKIHSRPLPGTPSFLEEFCKNNKLVAESRNIIKFLEFADGKIDLFEKFNTECFFECVFLASLPEFRGRKIAYHLVEHTVKLAKDIVAGNYPETIDENLKGKKPKIVFAIWTSKYSAKIGEKLGFIPLDRIPFANLKSIGISSVEKIPPEHTHCILGAVEI